LKFEILMPQEAIDTVMYRVYASPDAFEPHWNGPFKQQAERDFKCLRISASGVRCDLVE
jgi:hypothetical protein